MVIRGILFVKLPHGFYMFNAMHNILFVSYLFTTEITILCHWKKIYEQWFKILKNVDVLQQIFILISKNFYVHWK